MPSSHLILCHSLLLLSPIPPRIRVFSNVSTLHMRWPKYWSFTFSIIPSKEIPGLISFRMDWLDLLAVQGTLKSPVQHHSSIWSILPWNKAPLDWECQSSLSVETIRMECWTLTSKGNLLSNQMSTQPELTQDKSLWRPLSTGRQTRPLCLRTLQSTRRGPHDWLITVVAMSWRMNIRHYERK